MLPRCTRGKFDGLNSKGNNLKTKLQRPLYKVQRDAIKLSKR